MANISLTAALRSNLLSLQGTQSLLDQTQLRLATGKKVNTALDNPSAFFAAAALTNRANDLSNLLDSMGQAVQKLKAADQGIQTLTQYVEQAKAIAQSAQNSTSSSGLIRSGDLSTATVNDLTAAGTAAAGFVAGTVLVMSAGGGAAVTFTITAAKSMATLVSEINATTGFSAQIVDGSIAGAKRLEIRATNGQSLQLTAGTTASVVTRLNTTNHTGGANGVDGEGGAVDTTLVNATLNTIEQVALEKQYNDIRTQINNLVADAGYQGTNLINGDTLNVQFNESNTSKLTITSTALNTTNLGLAFTANSTFLTSGSITTATNQITAALTTLRSQAATFGNNLNIVQTRQDFTENLVNTLKAGADQLTLADKNEEGANLLSLQTAQQLGIQALALASQANQSVLRLFA